MWNWLKNIFSTLDDYSTRTGGIASPTDFRDIPLSALPVGSIPLEFKIISLTIKDQGQTPQCVAYSGSTINEFLQKSLGTNVVFDAEWLYKQCKLVDGIPDVPGTYFRTVMSVLTNVGCLPLGENPSNSDLIAKYKIKGYVSVPCDFTSLKQAIYAYGAVLMAFHGDNAGWQTGFIQNPKTVQWNHATTAIGYGTDHIDGQNSWGKEWGLNGDFVVPPTYLPFEAWAVINELPANWETLLPNPANKPQHVFNQNLSKGTEGDEVKALQDYLVYYGCMKRIDVNTGYGIFGLKTLASVRLFQQRYGLPQTGFVGQETRNKLNGL